MNNIFDLFDSFKDYKEVCVDTCLNIDLISKVYTFTRQYSKYKLLPTKSGKYAIILNGEIVEIYNDITKAKQEYVLLSMKEK